VESKGNLSNLNFNFLAETVLVTEIRHGLDSFFKLILDIELELGDFTDWISLIKVFSFFELMVNFLMNVKFKSIVRSSNGLGVKVNEFGDLDALDVVDIHDDEKVDEDTNTSSKESENLSWAIGCIVNITMILNEELSISSTLFQVYFFGVGVELINVIEMEVALSLAVALLLESSSEEVLV